jgi:hypothetical protein
METLMTTIMIRFPTSQPASSVRKRLRLRSSLRMEKRMLRMKRRWVASVRGWPLTGQEVLVLVLDLPSS